MFSFFQTKSHETVKRDMVIYGQDITSEILNGFQRLQIFRHSVSVSYTHLDVYKRQAINSAGAVGVVGFYIAAVIGFPLHIPFAGVLRCV